MRQLTKSLLEIAKTGSQGGIELNEVRVDEVLLKLDTGELLVLHLGMSGQLLRATPREAVAKHTHVIISFTQGGQLRFVDSSGDFESFGMIGYGDVFITAFLAGLRHLRDGSRSITPAAVHLQIAAQVFCPLRFRGQ